VDVRNSERAKAIKMPVIRFSQNICREIVVKFMRLISATNYGVTAIIIAICHYFFRKHLMHVYTYTKRNDLVISAKYQ